MAGTVAVGAGYGATVGSAGGPVGALIGAAAGAVVGGVMAAGIWFGGKWLANQMSEADGEAEESLSSAADGKPCEECATQEEQEKREKELEEEAGVEQKTKGKTKHGEKDGGMDQANEDFDSLKPDNVQTHNTPKGQLKTGTLKNGKDVKVRSFSSDGRPTLEIRNPSNGRGTEIRYNHLGV